MNKLIRTLIIVLSFFMTGFFSRYSFAQSALQTAAGAMSPNTWASFSTSGRSTDTLQSANGGTDGTVLGYSDQAAWDSTNKKLWYIGGDHGGCPMITNGSGYWCYRVLNYDDTTNTWSTKFDAYLNLSGGGSQGPNYYTGCTGGMLYCGDAHGYDATAIDVAHRRLYRIPYIQGQLWYTDLDTGGGLGTWKAAATSPIPRTLFANMDYVPEMGGLVVLDGQGTSYLYNVTSNKWSILGKVFNIGVSTTWNFVKYNPVQKIVIFGEEDGQPGNINPGLHMWKMSATVGITSLTPISNPPTGRIYDGNATNGIISADSVTGLYLFITCGNSRTFYTYNATTDTYTAGPTLPNAFDGVDLMQAFIPNFGVWFIAYCGHSSPCGVYLYKSSNPLPRSTVISKPEK